MKRYYAVLDKVSGLYGKVFEEVNDATAIRSFNFACEGRFGESVMAFSPGDHALYFMFEFDEHTGEVVSYVQKIQDGRSERNDVSHDV